MPRHSLYARLLTIALVMAADIARAQTSSPPPPCASCIILTARPGQSILADAPLNNAEILIRAEGDPAAVRAALGHVRAAGGRPGLLVTGPASVPVPERLAPVERVVFDLTAERSPLDETAFRLKTAITDARAASPGLAVGIVAPAAVLQGLIERDLAAYADFAGVPDPDARPPFPPSAGASRGAVPIRPFTTGANLEAQVTGWLVDLPDDVVLAANLVSDVARTASLLDPGLVAGGLAEVRCQGRPLPTYLDPESLETVAVAEACPGGITVTPDVAGTVRVPLSTGEIVIRVPAEQGRFAEGVDVVGSRDLTVREIIARHQAAAARQRRAVRHLISTGSMTLTFEAPGFPAPLAITSEAVIYAAPDRTEIEQRDIRVNGIAFQGGGVPRLPLLEPERVASPPLAITLTDVYRYTLAGRERVGDAQCHVVAFEPVDRSRSLFAGRAWIAVDSFALVKVSAVQTGLTGSIVSSEQTDEFARDDAGLWLLARSEVRQIYEGAGHRTPIHRVLRIARHEVNPASFAERRQAAYASASVMLRDTPEGYRYLQRDASGKASPNAVPAVAGRADRVRTLALGVILDPNISHPLPFAGLSYVDFNLFGTGTQLNAFFGGTYGQLAVSVPSLGGTRWQLAGRAHGIASSYNDRAFVEGREIYEANISQRPAHASVWLLRPLTPRFTARTGYEFDYTHFGRADTTAASFTVPADQASHAIRLALEGQWTGWTASLWWSGARRAGWRPWGPEAAAPIPGLALYEPAHVDFQRVGLIVARSFVASPRLVGRIEAAWMGGRDLDRFSRYTFGSFDNRLRGYPSALIRYDRGGVVRTSAAWAAGRLLRIDGFADTAYVHDPGFGPGLKRYTGIGAAAEVPAPFGTLVAVEWGYGFQGIDSDGRRGTQVVRISGYKMF